MNDPRALAVLIAALTVAAPGAQAPTAEQVVAKVLASRATNGYRIRAKITRTTVATGAATNWQLSIKGRREAKHAEVLYQILWPASAAGEAVVIEDAGDHRAAGFTFKAGVVTQMDRAVLASPLFGTDFTVEHHREMFWHWTSKRVVGEETIGKRKCTIVELRPAASDVTGYGFIQASIATDIDLPMRIQQFGRDGTRVKDIRSERIVHESGQWVAGRLIAAPASGRTTTVIEGSKYERDVVIPASDFSAETIRRFKIGG